MTPEQHLPFLSAILDELMEVVHYCAYSDFLEEGGKEALARVVRV